MEKSLRISVVVTVRNRPQYLKECVRSLIEQDYPSNQFEVLIVDDASDDELTPRAARELNQTHRQVHALYLPFRLGPGAARNYGNSHAHGELIVVADSDDISLPQRLRAIDAYFEGKQFECDIFYSGANAVDKNLKHKFYHHARWGDVKLLDRGVQEIWHPTMAYRASILKCNGGAIEYPEDMADVDLGFLLAARNAGLRFGLLDTPLVLYRSHPGQISRADHALQQKLAREKRERL